MNISNISKLLLLLLVAGILTITKSGVHQKARWASFGELLHYSLVETVSIQYLSCTNDSDILETVKYIDLDEDDKYKLLEYIAQIITEDWMNSIYINKLKNDISHVITLYYPDNLSISLNYIEKSKILINGKPTDFIEAIRGDRDPILMSLGTTDTIFDKILFEISN